MTPSAPSPVDQAVLAFAHRTLACASGVALAALVFGIAVAQGCSFALDDPSWQLPTAALFYGLVFAIPSTLALHIGTRNRALSLRAIEAFLVWFASGGVLLGALNLATNPTAIAATYNGSSAMYMMVIIALTGLLMHPRLSLAVGAWCAIQHLGLFWLARPHLVGLVGPAEVTTTLTSWGEVARQGLMLACGAAMVALFGGMAREVTGRIAAEQLHRRVDDADELQQQAQQTHLKANNAAKGEFVTTMSHELRTPMNAILGFAQRLQSAPELDAQSRHGVEAILSNSRQLLQLVGDALDTADIESGRGVVSLGAVHPRALLDDVRKRVGHTRMLTVVDTEVPAQILGDEKRLRQVLVHLIEDAGGAVRVDLTAPEENLLEIRVEALGTARPQRGLRIAIAGQIIEAMGGTLTVADDHAVASLPSGIKRTRKSEELTAFPDRSDAAWLREPVLIGDLAEAALRANTLAERRPELATFAARVSTLADDFDDETLLELLEA